MAVSYWFGSVHPPPPPPSSVACSAHSAFLTDGRQSPQTLKAGLLAADLYAVGCLVTQCSVLSKQSLGGNGHLRFPSMRLFPSKDKDGVTALGENLVQLLRLSTHALRSGLLHCFTFKHRPAVNRISCESVRALGRLVRAPAYDRAPVRLVRSNDPFREDRRRPGAPLTPRSWRAHSCGRVLSAEMFASIAPRKPHV